MDEAAFEKIAVSEWEQVPAHFKRQVENVALIIEDEPSDAVRREDDLEPNETLLGRYHGIPNSERGASYGIGGTLPDTITLYRLPILEEAQELADEAGAAEPPRDFPAFVTQAVRETLWHELGHYFGMDEDSVRTREHGHSNRFRP
ncbi:MAG TPA: metallopeptidase family protein [Candidatus Paceibacterota bacterium]